MNASENRIRDQLASRLSLIEAGLEYVTSNYHLHNPHGADGFVDILGRDSTGAFVVIELKRSNSTARQALHEVGKYVDLLARDKGLDRGQIRAMVVSTDWHELIVPFSYYVRESDFNLAGFELKLDTDGLTPIGAERVSELPGAQPRTLTASQRRIDGRLLRSLDEAWSSVKARLIDLDVNDFVALHLVDGDGSKMIVLALGTVLEDQPRAPMRSVLTDAEAFDDEELDLIPTEELVLLGMEYEGHPLGVCYPEKVGALLAASWSLDRIERVGVFEDETLFPQKDITELCEGWTGGLSAVHYSGRARTSNSAQWKKFRGAISRVTADSPGWAAPTRLWLDELQVANPQWDVSVNCYDQHDLLQSLLHMYKTPDWPEGVPFLALAVEAPNNKSFGLSGYLSWDGQVVDIAEGLRSAYKNIGEWGDLRAFELQSDANLKLLSAWHLSYVVLEKFALVELPEALSVKAGVLQRNPVRDHEFAEGMLRPVWMIDFLEAHEEQLDTLVSYLKDHVWIFPDTASQMHRYHAKVDSNWY